MTRERTREMLPVFAAWAEGKAIQVREPGEPLWKDFWDLSPDFEDWQWRIKPEQRHFWVGLPCNAAPVGLVCCGVKPEYPAVVPLIHCVEVLDDQPASEVKK